MPAGLIIPADSEQPVRLVVVEGLADMQKAVGGYIEAVELHHPIMNLLVNEEGLLQDQPQVNRRASIIRVVHTQLDERLVGDALLLGPVDQSNNFTDVPTDIQKLLLYVSRFDIEAVDDDPFTLTTIEHAFDTWDTAYERAANLTLDSGDTFRVIPG